MNKTIIVTSAVMLSGIDSVTIIHDFRLTNSGIATIKRIKPAFVFYDGGALASYGKNDIQCNFTLIQVVGDFTNISTEQHGVGLVKGCLELNESQQLDIEVGVTDTIRLGVEVISTNINTLCDWKAVLYIEYEP